MTLLALLEHTARGMLALGRRPHAVIRPWPLPRRAAPLHASPLALAHHRTSSRLACSGLHTGLTTPARAQTTLTRPSMSTASRSKACPSSRPKASSTHSRASSKSRWTTSKPTSSRAQSTTRYAVTLPLCSVRECPLTPLPARSQHHDRQKVHLISHAVYYTPRTPLTPKHPPPPACRSTLQP